MREHPFYFRGIGEYNPKTGEVFYNIVMPKIEGHAFKCMTDKIEKISYQGKDCLMIYIHNGIDDENYGTTPEIMQISFIIDNVQDFGGKPINILINHDANMVPRGSKKPGIVGIGVVRP